MRLLAVCTLSVALLSQSGCKDQPPAEPVPYEPRESSDRDPDEAAPSPIERKSESHRELADRFDVVEEQRQTDSPLSLPLRPGDGDSAAENGLKTKLAMATMAKIHKELIRYHSIVGRYPSGPEGLAVLTRIPAPGSSANWSPVLSPTDLQDPWGSAIGYEIVRISQDGRTYLAALLTSAGPDGKMQTGDDLTWPDLRQSIDSVPGAVEAQQAE